MRTTEEYRTLEEAVGAFIDGRADTMPVFDIESALREAAEMVRDREAMEMLRSDCPGARWHYDRPGLLGAYSPEDGECDPADAILGEKPHD